MIFSDNSFIFLFLTTTKIVNSEWILTQKSLQKKQVSLQNLYRYFVGDYDIKNT